MAKKRERIDIIYDMLQAIHNKPKGIKQTHLMYKANLSYNQLKKYLEELKNRKLIIEIEYNKKPALQLTQKGYELQKKIEEMKLFDEAFGFEK